MDFLKVIKLPIKHALRTASNKQYRKDEAEAKKSAGIGTRKAIQRGKQRGYWVNGSETYHRIYNQKMNEANDRKKARDKTIDEI